MKKIFSNDMEFFGNNYLQRGIFVFKIRKKLLFLGFFFIFPQILRLLYLKNNFFMLN